ncbi:MAG: hypothetical protein VX460_13055 [Planctomycetota bacterium]|nr:hypothetical protein [Planctomycetota bacterium]
MRLAHLLLLTTLGCSTGEDVPLHPGEGALAEVLGVELSRSSDRLGFGVAWAVTVTNAGEAAVDDLVLVLDEEWSAPIRRLRVDRSPGASGAELPAGLAAGERLVVRDSHDITNHHVLRDLADTPYPSDQVPRTVGFESAGSRGVWRVR